jgi:hypothetical protein
MGQIPRTELQHCPGEQSYDNQIPAAAAAAAAGKECHHVCVVAEAAHLLFPFKLSRTKNGAFTSKVVPSRSSALLASN